MKPLIIVIAMMSYYCPANADREAGSVSQNADTITQAAGPSQAKHFANDLSCVAQKMLASRLHPAQDCNASILIEDKLQGMSQTELKKVAVTDTGICLAKLDSCIGEIVSAFQGLVEQLKCHSDYVLCTSGRKM